MASLASRLLTRGRFWSWHIRYAVLQAVAPRRKVLSRGLSFTLSCENWITHYRWKTYNSKEPETLDWLDTFVADGDVLFDVGANIGVYSLYAAARHPAATVIAFEPEYANLHLLRDNIILNGVQARIEAYSIALGDRSGLSRLHIQDLTPGAALHTESGARLRLTDTGHPVLWAEGIWVMRMDDFCARRGLWPHAIKIDVDGAERRMLAGGRRALTAPALRTVLIEMSDNPADRMACEALLVEAGLERVDSPTSPKIANQVWARPPRRPPVAASRDA